MMTTSLLIGLLLLALVAFAVAARLLPPRPAPEAPIWTLASCQAPPRPLTVEQAHHAMQLHIECTLRSCGCKAAAFRILVDNDCVTRRSRVSR